MRSPDTASNQSIEEEASDDEIVQEVEGKLRTPFKEQFLHMLEKIGHRHDLVMNQSIQASTLQPYSVADAKLSSRSLKLEARTSHIGGIRATSLVHDELYLLLAKEVKR
jgi:hypothetical protein